MNPIKKVLLIFTLFISAYGYAQPKQWPDSVRVEFPDQQSFAIFELRNYTVDKEIIRNFPQTLGSLLSHIQRSVIETDLVHPHDVEIVYEQDRDRKPEQEVIITRAAQAQTSITLKDNAITQLLPQGWRLEFTGTRFHISVYAPDFERLLKLAQLTFDPVVNTLDANPEMFQSQRMGKISRIVVKEGNVAYSKLDHRLPGDMIGLHAGAGAGLFRDKLYPELNFTTALYLASRYKQYSQRFALTYEVKFFALKNQEGSYQSLPNSFLSFSYARNFAKERPRWVAIGAGYLVHSKGDLYSGDTMKLFLESDIGSAKLNIVPEFYLSNGFKDFAYGIKVQYKF